MDGTKDRKFTELEEKLQLRKALLDITNRIHAAQNIKQILVDLKDGILNLFNAHSITIYVVDRPRNEIYSMFLIGTQVKEIRVPINNKSIAGYVANTGKVVNIADAYDVAELKMIDKELTFDLSWDKKSGFRTKQILAAPIFHNKTLMGVVQILNKKKGTGKFSEDERGFLQEISDVLGVAFFNQERYARRRKTRFDYLISHDLLKEEELDSAWEESREAKETIEDFLMKKYKISREDLGRSFEEFFRCKFIPFHGQIPHPGRPAHQPQEGIPPPGTLGPAGEEGRHHPHHRGRSEQHPQAGHDRKPPEDEVRPLRRLPSRRHHQIHQPFLSVPEDESSITDILGKLDADERAAMRKRRSSPNRTA